MALVPLTMRPSFIIRRRAIVKGLLGNSTMWRLVAVAIFGRRALSKLFLQNSNNLGRRRIGMGHMLTVSTSAPLTRKQAKRLGITKGSLEAAARAELGAAQQAS